jgi:hypothetical protein
MRRPESSLSRGGLSYGQQIKDFGEFHVIV